MFHKLKHKIKVFISSKIDKKHTPIRKHLQYLLLETGLYEEPFVFEDEPAGSISAKDFYLNYLKKSDVVAFLIDNKDGVSEGVQVEYQYAKEKDIRKIFVFCDERSKKKTDIQEELEQKLGEKYVTCHKFYEMAETAYISLIQDLVNVYTNSNSSNYDNGSSGDVEGGFNGPNNEPNSSPSINDMTYNITHHDAIHGTAPINGTAPIINSSNLSNINTSPVQLSAQSTQTDEQEVKNEQDGQETPQSTISSFPSYSSYSSCSPSYSSYYSIEKIKLPDESAIVSYLLSLIGVKDYNIPIQQNIHSSNESKTTCYLALSFLTAVLYKDAFNKKGFAELKKGILSSSDTRLRSFLNARFDAIEAVFEGRIEAAIENARNALSIAIASSFIPQWLVLDVAVDIMNLVRIKYHYMEYMKDGVEEKEKKSGKGEEREEHKEHEESKESEESEGTKKKKEEENGDKHSDNDERATKHRASTFYFYSYIDDEDYKSANNLVTQSLVSYPIIDRLQENLYKKIASIYESEQLKSPYLISFGNSDITTVFQYIAKTYLIALMHGSFTHISLIQEQLISVLTTYTNLYSNRIPVVERIRLHFVTREQKSKLDEIIRTYHADADILTPEEAKEIIDSIKRIGGTGGTGCAGGKGTDQAAEQAEEKVAAKQTKQVKRTGRVEQVEGVTRVARTARTARTVERDKQLFYFCGKFGYYCADEDFYEIFMELHNTALTWVREDRNCYYNLILDYVFSFYEGVLKRSHCKKYALDFCLSLMDALGNKRSLPFLEAISRLLLNIVNISMLTKSNVDNIDNVDNGANGDINESRDSTNLTPSKIKKIIDFVTYGINDKNIMHVPHLKNLLICLSLWLSETEQSVANYLDLDCVLQSKLPNFYKTEYEFDIALRKTTKTTSKVVAETTSKASSKTSSNASYNTSPNASDISDISDIWDVLAKHIDVYIKGVSKCNALAQEGTYGPNSGYLRALRLIAFNIADNIATTTASNAISKTPKDDKDDADNHQNAGNTDNAVEEMNEKIIEEMKGADCSNTGDNRASSKASNSGNNGNNSNNSTDIYTQIKKIADVAIETLSCKTQQIWCKVAACEILMAIRKLMDSQQQLFAQVRTVLWNNRFLYSRVENYSSFGSLGFNNDHPIQLEVAYNLLLISYGCEAGYEANLFDLLFSIPNRQKYVVIQSLSYLLSFLRFYDSSYTGRSSRSDNSCSSVISGTSANSGTTIDKHADDATSTQDSYQNTSNTVIRAICNYVNFCSNNSEERDVKLQAIQLLVELCKYNETRFTALRRLSLFMTEGSAEGATDAKVTLMYGLESVITREPYKDNNDNNEEEAEENEENTEADYYISSILNQAKICRHYLVRHLAGLIEKKYRES